MKFVSRRPLITVWLQVRILPGTGKPVFIGHGRAAIWRELKEFLQERLQLSVEDFNSVPVAGVTIASRLEEILDRAAFAFLIMTAEDEQLDGKFRARENVVHEAGLFQGRLGFKKAIILLEDGCEEFSNIQGLNQIRFPKNKISSEYENIRRVLEREGLDARTMGAPPASLPHLPE
jgi:predicted nucleotide-binding protein